MATRIHPTTLVVWIMTIFTITFNLAYAQERVDNFRVAVSDQFEEIESLEDYIKEKPSLGKRIFGSLKQIDIKLSTSIFDVTSEDTGLSLAVKYKREIENSDVPGYYLRSDEYRFEQGFDAGNFLENMVSPLSLGVDKGTVFKFIRQYSNRAKAVFDITTDDNLKKIPLNSTRVIENQEPGDYFSMTAKMNLFAGFEGSGSPTTGINVSGSAFYIISGKFLIQTYRMAKEKVRVKIFAGDSRGGSISGEVGIGYQFFKIDPSNDLTEKLVEEILDFDFIELFHTKQKGEILVFDYIFDLKDKDARKAFDDLMTPKLLIKDYDIIKNLFGSNDDDNSTGMLSRINLERKIETEKLISNMAQVIEIAKEDEDIEKKRIERGFQAQINFQNKSTSFDINLIIFKYEKSKNYLQNAIKSFETNGEKYYYAPSFSKKSEIGFDIEVISFKSEKRDSFFSIFKTMPTDEPQDAQFSFSDLGVFQRMQENTFNKFEDNRLRKHLKYNLVNDEEFKKFNDWEWFPTWRLCFFTCLRREVLFESEFFLNPKGLNYLTENYTSIEEYKNALKSIYEDKEGKYIKNPIFPRTSSTDAKARRDSRVTRIATKLYNITSPNSELTSRQKVTELMSFRNKSKFRRNIPFLLKKLIKDSELFSESVYYNITLSRPGVIIKYEYGTDTTNLYEQIRTIEASFEEDDQESYLLFKNSVGSEDFEHESLL